MKLEEIQRQWDEDVEIDRHNLGEEALRIHSLHAKYYRIYVNEALLLKKMEEDLKELRFNKYEFLTLGPGCTTNDLPDTWELPSRGKILKNEVQPYLDADRDIINKTLSVGLQKEKVVFVKSIIDSLVARGWNIKAAIDYERFRAGG